MWMALSRHLNLNLSGGLCLLGMGEAYDEFGFFFDSRAFTL